MATSLKHIPMTSSIQHYFSQEFPRLSQNLQVSFSQALPSFSEFTPEQQRGFMQATMACLDSLLNQQIQNTFLGLFIQGSLASFKLELREQSNYFKVVRQAMYTSFQSLLEKPDMPSIAALEYIMESLFEAQNSHLFEYITNQEEQLTRLQGEASQSQKDAKLYRALTENAPDCIAITDAAGKIVYANPSFQTMFMPTGSVLNHQINTFLNNDADFQGIVRAVMEQGSWSGLLDFKRLNGDFFTSHIAVFAIHDEQGNLIAMPGMMRDISKELHREQENARLQQELIETQQMMLRELSTPIIPLTDAILVLPLVGRIDSNRAQQVMENLLEGVLRYTAEVVILDITGVPFIDADIADTLIRIARAVRLLGAHMIVTGIRAEVAQTLVALDLHLDNIETHATLQTGIRQAIHGYTKELVHPLSKL